MLFHFSANTCNKFTRTYFFPDRNRPASGQIFSARIQWESVWSSETNHYSSKFLFRNVPSDLNKSVLNPNCVAQRSPYWLLLEDFIDLATRLVLCRWVLSPDRLETKENFAPGDWGMRKCWCVLSGATAMPLNVWISRCCPAVPGCPAIVWYQMTRPASHQTQEQQCLYRHYHIVVF